MEDLAEFVMKTVDFKIAFQKIYIDLIAVHKDNVEKMFKFTMEQEIDQNIPFLDI